MKKKINIIFKLYYINVYIYSEQEMYEKCLIIKVKCFVKYSVWTVECGPVMTWS